jgi:hypothetical protein
MGDEDLCHSTTPTDKDLYLYYLDIVGIFNIDASALLYANEL